jgi:hypothetical protein
MWGSLGVLFVLVEKHGRLKKQTVDLLCHICDILPRFRGYKRIFDLRKHRRLSLALAQSYLDIIGLCMAIRETLASQVQVPVKKFSRPILRDV